jgi:hypothetical protein
MPTPAFCALSEAYGGDWNKKEAASPPKTPAPVVQNNVVSNDVREVCPNCSGCLKENNKLQQKVVDQTIWPRPQWIPQDPQGYVPFDPYNRYWGILNNNRREEFGNIGENSNSNALYFILFIILGISIIELLYKLFNKKQTV